jgi:hypothetical protein
VLLSGRRLLLPGHSMSHERTVRPGSSDLVFGGVMALPLPTAGFTPV